MRRDRLAPEAISRTRSAPDQRARMLRHLPEEQRVELNGVATNLLTAGAGPPVILLHGGIECGGAYWAPIARQLAGDFHLIIPDFPGLGESEPFAHVNDAAFAEWFADLQRVTGALRPTLVAHSLLGSLAARFAARHSDRLERLVVYGAPGVGPYRMPLKLLITAARFLLRPTRRNSERFESFALLDRERTRALDPDWFDAFSGYSFSCAVRPHVKRTMNQLIKLGSQRIPDRELRTITAPTTLIWGAHDRMVPLALAQRASAQFGWALHTIAGAAHVPHMEQPPRFVAALKATLSAGGQVAGPLTRARSRQTSRA